MAKRRKEQFDWEDEEQEEIIWVSKSEIKRDAEALKQLGEKLVNLTKTNLEKIPLEENILDAIALAQRLQKEAKRRQLQYIGKLLRQVDAEPIQEALDKIENKHNHQQALLHKLELLRDELIAKGDEALSNVLNDYPYADRQHLRNLIRAAQKEKAQNKPPKAYREIFQYLKELAIEE
ncbi:MULTISPECIES: ribosome biogenesis factor YjgA [Avibacterium]|uniref:Dual-action ribosomal maturation protein DarP n=2 Tax=Avibacterium TaxID=292486 RepID=A0A3S4HKQ5_AVIVO|nr:MULTISPECIES: ribosome biogenesis factor YjgA [Avibacterium]SUB23690.1 ribosome-associated, YjgA family protein [Avibacterium avium]VEB25220.1 x96 protein [Avibacterium volantium]